LHIKDNEKEENGMEVMIIFHNTIPDIAVDEDFEKILLEQEMGSILLLEHGFGLLLYKPKKVINSYPIKLNIKFGTDNHPQMPDIGHLETYVNWALSGRKLDYERNSPNIKALPQLMMLAAHTFIDYEMQSRVGGVVNNPHRTMN